MQYFQGVHKLNIGLRWINKISRGIANWHELLVSSDTLDLRTNVLNTKQKLIQNQQ